MHQGAIEAANEDVVQGSLDLIVMQRQAEMMQRALTVFHTEFNKFATEDLPQDLSPRTRGKMIRALYTAASGMSAQQMNLDTIANNLANSSTTGFRQLRLRVSGHGLPEHGHAGRGAEPEHGFGRACRSAWEPNPRPPKSSRPRAS